MVSYDQIQYPAKVHRHKGRSTGKDSGVLAIRQLAVVRKLQSRLHQTIGKSDELTLKDI
jgi:hypothetical protein